ncbi:hypothetical protein KCU92_g319, partial [Aureobasidium melanogenum]
MPCPLSSQTRTASSPYLSYFHFIYIPLPRLPTETLSIYGTTSTNSHKASQNFHLSLAHAFCPIYMSFDSCHHFSYPLSPPAMTSLALATRIIGCGDQLPVNCSVVLGMMPVERVISMLFVRFRLKVNLTVALLTRGYL